MKKFNQLVLVIYFLQSLTFAQVTIKFTVFASIPDSERIFITGNNSQLGNWTPDKSVLIKINDTTWQQSFIFSANQTIEYKFSKGSWSNEALTDDGKVPGNYVLKVTNDTCLTFSIKNWKDRFFKVSDGIYGNFNIHKNFFCKNLKPRDVVVWLPPDYYSDTTKKYPVLYMQDGQNIFNPATSAFGVDWRLDEIADSLINVNKIQELIIIGVYNTADRWKEYNDSDTGRIYLNFLLNELKPFIDDHYRTKTDKANTAIGGSSLGGLISLIAVWEFSDYFSKAACLSPAFKIGSIDYVSSVINYTGKKKDIKLYIDNGGIGLEASLQPGVDDMLKALIQKGYELGKDILWIKDNEAEHNEAAWSKRANQFLQFLFPNIE